MSTDPIDFDDADEALPDVDVSEYRFPHPVGRVRKDILQAAGMLSKQEVRYLVDLYYEAQGFRMATSNQTRALGEAEEPESLLGWAKGSFLMVEDEIRRGLHVYSMKEPTGVGVWARSIVGIGPVIAAGLLAHIDIERARTAGHIWRYAGLDPTQTWLGRTGAEKVIEEAFGTSREITEDRFLAVCGAAGRQPDALRRIASDKDGKLTRDSLQRAISKRPWNASLKVLCWKIGESFVKVKGRPTDFYGHLYETRKLQEQQNNDKGLNAERAAAILKAKRIGRATEAYKAYSQGLLPPAHIHARAKRWAVKLFLAHLQHVMWEAKYQTPPPFPYVIEKLGHTGVIDVPNHTCIATG